MRPIVVHLGDQGRVGIDAARLVALQRAVGPGALPQPVHHLHELVGGVVARVVLGQLVAAHGERAAAQERRDDVPADAPAGHVIQRRHAPGKQIWRLVGGAAGNGEAEVLGYQRHGRHDHCRIEARGQRAAAERRCVALLVGVGHPERVGQKQGIEQAAFQQAGIVGPIVDAGEIECRVARMAPKAESEEAWVALVERVEPDFPGHAMASSCRDCGATSRRRGIGSNDRFRRGDLKIRPLIRRPRIARPASRQNAAAQAFRSRHARTA